MERRSKIADPILDAVVGSVEAKIRSANKLLQELGFPGRIAVNGATMIEVSVVCNGRIFDMGYMCSLPPNHSGECWSNIKKCHFIPDNLEQRDNE